MTGPKYDAAVIERASAIMAEATDGFVQPEYGAEGLTAILVDGWRLVPPEAVDSEDEFDEGPDDLSDCPYYRRSRQLPGHDPNGICGYGCRDEPVCITDCPRDGWPGDPPVTATKRRRYDR